MYPASSTLVKKSDWMIFETIDTPSIQKTCPKSLQEELTEVPECRISMCSPSQSIEFMKQILHPISAMQYHSLLPLAQHDIGWSRQDITVAMEKVLPNQLRSPSRLCRQHIRRIARFEVSNEISENPPSSVELDEHVIEEAEQVFQAAFAMSVVGTSCDKSAHLPSTWHKHIKLSAFAANAANYQKCVNGCSSGHKYQLRITCYFAQAYQTRRVCRKLAETRGWLLKWSQISIAYPSELHDICTRPLGWDAPLN